MRLECPLTPRQLDVLLGAAQDLTDDEIAAELSVSSNTVRTHMAMLKERLKVRSRAGAVAIAMRNGWIR